MTTRTLTIGRIVHYRLHDGEHKQAGGNARPGMTCPAMIVRAWSDECANLRVICDGPNDLWVTSRMIDESEEAPNGTWFWPKRD